MPPLVVAIVSLLAQATTTAPLAGGGSGSGNDPNSGAAIVFFGVCAVLAVGAVLIFLSAKRARDAAATPSDPR